MKKINFWLCLLSGLMLMFIGLNFIFNPLGAEAGYGIHTNTNGDFSFQYIKGIRDFFSGLIIVVLIFTKEYKALGYVLLLGAIIPAADFCIVISHPDFTAAHLYAHTIAVMICVVCGIYYLKNPANKKQPD
ncbi:hypothetical protein A9P82_12060 [Arachidicoccus ginsenosidimutans]|uniref:DUF4267 domain-containing protein n=1 Tax=Arachidicoccus sp. BS20 TaxID=1850526 RepID=UPI0007F09762|nr:DUF4267 domain-containing protein [Arachidicoccus sp. BS20]ANI89957.1 hypothetical protein A9P82_12060 [Arachidicoccus sp. BS20]